jgi:hypothetical protein
MIGSSALAIDPSNVNAMAARVYHENRTASHKSKMHFA